ncbi:abortive infection family protein [Solidesulfovibrio sp. C21]|uniref:abortive infection family protein n=1 Tax=Solidesulfovibrio sp. C21 TaxID=3398613 RepID=UPI0039FBD8B7
MTPDWCPGIRDFCAHWSHASTLQQTFETLEREFADNNDACIDAAKGIVECACQVIINNLDDPRHPLKPKDEHPSFGSWVSAAVRVLGLSEVRDEGFKKLISQHHKLTTALGTLRDAAGTVSHGKNGFIHRLSMHHRRSAMLAADAIVTFLHEAYLEREPDPAQTLEPYERFVASNDLIDSLTGLDRAEVDDESWLSVTVLLPGGDEIPLKIPPSQLLFGIDRQAYKEALKACRNVTLADMKDEEET